MIMKVAIPTWDGRVSPVMDTARHLLVTEFADGSEVSRETVIIPQANISSRVSFLTDLGIDVLICGAISHQFEHMLAASGIEPYPWFRGNVDEIIAAYFDGVLQNDSFLLPGCRRRGRGRGRRRGWRAGQGGRKQF
jgi:predicted Fe-Mo cluster-binding NifX family protein